jgi:serine/threonine-protein kinase
MHDDDTKLSENPVPIASSLVVGSVLGEKYRLTRFLGQGGMGSVFAAEQTELAVPLAIKVMHPHVAARSEYVERFRREARAALLLAHPNVVRVLDFGQDAGTFYIVMEFIQGIALDEWLHERNAPPPLAEVVPIALDVLNALEAAHAHGIVHRDLKPENVILTRDAQSQRVAKVLDFGLAHVESPEAGAPTLTRPDMVAGTPAYMSPEQSRSLRVGPATDLYAFGCLLTELLQLAPPFDGASPMEIISQHLFMPPPPLARPADAEPVPPLLEKLRLELLAKHAHQRPASAATVRERLLEAVDPELSAKRLPSRKGELPSGGREDRVPDWNAVPHRGAAVTSTTSLPILLVGEKLRDVVLSAGLAAHGFEPIHATNMDATHGARLVVVDAGESLEEALAALGRAQLPTLVVLASLDAGAMRRLIEAGAADVLAHPVSPDVLAKKLRRLARRR